MRCCETRSYVLLYISDIVSSHFSYHLKLLNWYNPNSLNPSCCMQTVNLASLMVLMGIKQN